MNKKFILMIFLLLIFTCNVAIAENLNKDINILKNVFFVKKPVRTLVFIFKTIPKYQIIQQENIIKIILKNTLIGETSKWINSFPKDFFKNIDMELKNNDLIISLTLFKPFKLKDNLFETNLFIEFFEPIDTKTKIYSKKDGVEKKKKERDYFYKVPKFEYEEVEILFGKKEYKGQPISVNFQNADIHAVLRLLAEIGNFNLVVSDKVKGKITLKLKKVTWDQVLDIILVNNKLAMIKTGNVVRILTISELKAENEEYQAYLESLKKLERQKDLVTKIFYLKYIKVSDIIEQIKEIIGERGKVSINVLTNSLIVKAPEKDIKEISHLLKKVDKPRAQLLIEARIVEIEDNYARTLGINWNISDFSISVGGRKAVGEAGIDLDVGLINLGFRIGKYGAIESVDTALLDLKLQALEKEGVARIISSPKILTLNNQPAIIKQGKKIPYLRLNKQGSATTEFIDAVISLKVIPQITGDNRIALDIEIEKNTPDFGTLVNGVPAVITRYAKTKVIINSGETLIIGGIKVKDLNESTNRIIGLGKIPIIGYLFKQKAEKTSKTELMIFITPKITSVEIPGIDY